MRRTVLSALALACTAVLASTGTAFADGPTKVPADRPASQAPATAAPAPGTEPADGRATPAPKAPTDGRATPAPSKAPAEQRATPAPSKAPAEQRARKQVPVVPKGAPDTGVATDSAPSGAQDGLLIGGGAAAALAMGGAAVLVVRRRRATGA
ncbi:sortase-dependent protein [Streptomyces sparsogenes]|uniref:sortase-dependent protein n=1 Tax=Streptomyces sparsogenes TaxID=67365 RepID=UPI00340A1518